MFTRALTSSTRLALRQTAPTSRLALAALPPHLPVFRQISTSLPRFETNPTEASKKPSHATSTAHPTVPHAAGPQTPFFARKNIGLEVTPLLAFVATILTLALSFLAKNYFFDDGVAHRHGVDDDEALKKVLALPGGKSDEKK